MSEDPAEDPKKALKQGLGLLWRAARGAATGVRKEVKGHGGLGKSIDDAGRELVRAASNVVGRIAGEVKKQVPPSPARPEDRPRKPGDDGDPSDKDDPKSPKKKPTGPTPDDPGFSIMKDGDDAKPR